MSREEDTSGIDGACTDDRRISKIAETLFEEPFPTPNITRPKLSRR